MSTSQNPQRRDFLKIVAAGAASLALPPVPAVAEPALHILSSSAQRWWAFDWSGRAVEFRMTQIVIEEPSLHAWEFLTNQHPVHPAYMRIWRQKEVIPKMFANGSRAGITLVFATKDVSECPEEIGLLKKAGL